MRNKKPIVAICYDFDGTLSPGNMQEYGFFPGLSKKDRDTFWKQSEAMAKENGADSILSYMFLMLEKARNNPALKTTKQAIRDYGKEIELYPGVENWLKRISSYGKEIGVCVEHYIVSSGLVEMIDGCPISKHFKRIYACSFKYDQNEVAEWPAQAVNCTTKTQFLFRISKAADDLSDTKKLNAPINEEDRHVPFSRMIYIGDGSTDVPCMTVVKTRGGHSIAVYKPKSKKKQEALKFYEEGRANFCVPADYSDGKALEITVKAILDKIKADWVIQQLEPKESPTISSDRGANDGSTSIEDQTDQVENAESTSAELDERH